jgi:uncharacterized membrane protein YeaQ/YmgE (transglycosylase-associated protein family)
MMAHLPENPITLLSAIWIILGACVGWAAATVLSATTHSARIENVLVGIFGAFIGGELVVAQLNQGKVPTSFSIGAFGLALGTAVLMILALHLMRKLVGPMRAHKTKTRN